MGNVKDKISEMLELNKEERNSKPLKENAEEKNLMSQEKN